MSLKVTYRKMFKFSLCGNFNFYFVIVALAYSVSFSCAYKIIWDNDVDIDLNEIDDDLVRSDERRIPNWFFIFPGTKWCGVGDIAANDSDLGTERDTDKCCRTHDKCPDIIEGYQTKNELTNPSFYTRLACFCDNEFYKCLKSISLKSAIRVGQIYFTILGTQCYQNDHPISGCIKYTSFPKKKCIEHGFDRTQPKKYQWFDVPNF